MNIFTRIYLMILDGLFILGFPVFGGGNFKEKKVSKKYPIVIMPGFFADDKMFTMMKSYFESKGYKVYVPHFCLQLKDINHLAKSFENYVEKNKIGKFIFVGHSIGGLIGLVYLGKGRNDVKEFISLCSPFKGTWSGYMAFMFKSTRQLTDSEFLDKLGKIKAKGYSIATKYDELVPLKSSKLAGLKFVEVDSFGHIGAVFDERLFTEIEKILKRKGL